MLLLKKRVWIVFTICLSLVFILAAFPASWLVYGVQQVVPGLRVQSVSGSLWSGVARDSQWVHNGRVLPLGELQWRLSPWSGLLLEPCFRFSASAPAQIIRGQSCHSLLTGVATLEGVRATLPMERLSPFFAVELSGVMEATAPKVVWASQRLGETDLTLLWRQAELYSGSDWIPLGNLQGKVSDDGEGGLISRWQDIETGNGSREVAIDLRASLTNLSAPSPTLRITGTINPGNQARLLAPMLSFIGEATGNGAYRIDIKE